MYNKFSATYKRYNLHDYEDQPPEKKLVSDGDSLIKQLAEKQRKTNIVLDEELSAKNKFYKSTEMVSVTQYISGTTSLQDFSSVVHHADNLEHLKKCGLTTQEIELFMAYKKGSDMQGKHKNINYSVLQEELARINEKIQCYEENRSPKDPKVNEPFRKNLSLSEKPDSIETKLLKFALENEKTNKEKIPEVMDNIRDIECGLMSDLTKVDIKKIRKKARSLARQIQEIDEIPKPEPIITKTPENNFLLGKSKWDVRESQITKPTKIKTFTCERRNLYTIKNGQIIKINDSNVELDNKAKKLSLEEIKNIPKFCNYEKGIPSPVLYLKNLPKNVNEADLDEIFGTFFDGLVSLKIMDGRMKGQAFLTFKDKGIAEEVLEECNGTLLRDKPIIIQFGKQAPNG